MCVLTGNIFPYYINVRKLSRNQHLAFFLFLSLYSFHEEVIIILLKKQNQDYNQNATPLNFCEVQKYWWGEMQGIVTKGAFWICQGDSLALVFRAFLTCAWHQIAEYQGYGALVSRSSAWLMGNSTQQNWWDRQPTHTAHNPKSDTKETHHGISIRASRIFWSPCFISSFSNKLCKPLKQKLKSYGILQTLNPAFPYSLGVQGYMR